MTQVKVCSDLTNIDWDKNIVIEASDKKAFSDPKLSEADGQYYIICEKMVAQSEFIHSLIEEASENTKRAPLPFENIDGKTMSYIVYYMAMHVDNPPETLPQPLGKPLREIINTCDINFLDQYLLQDAEKDQYKIMKDVVAAAHQISIPSLIGLICAAFADIIERVDEKDPDKIRARFGIADDLSPEEKEALKKEYEGLN